MKVKNPKTGPSTPLLGIVAILLAVPAHAARGGGTHPADEYIAANERLHAAIVDAQLKDEDPESYYRRIDAILAGTSADPNLILRGKDSLDSDGEVYIAGQDLDPALTYALGLRRDLRLAGILLNHGADPRRTDGNSSSAVEKVCSECDPIALALLRFHGFEPDFTEKWVSIPSYTKISEVFSSSLLDLDTSAECAATRAVATMPLESLAGWVRYPDPMRDEWFDRLHMDGELDVLRASPGYYGAMERGRRRGIRMIDPDEARIRHALESGIAGGLPASAGISTARSPKEEPAGVPSPTTAASRTPVRSSAGPADR